MMFWSSMQLARKIPFIIVLAGLVAAIATTVVADLRSENLLRQEAEAKLTAVLDARHRAISDYLEAIRSDLRFQAGNPEVHAALAAFKEGWAGLEGDRRATLQRLYITDNPNPTGSKENLDFARDGSAYSAAHRRYHPWMRQFLREREYYDIFLFDPDGNLVYTVFKELDYATNLVSGEYASSGLGQAFQVARANPTRGFQAFFDFAPYAPSNDAPASFISTPMIGENGRLDGVLVFQMPIGRINAIMQDTAGLGRTGETYLIGNDRLMRSDSRFSETSTILARRIETAAADAGIAGRSGILEKEDYRGVEVLSAFRPLDFMGTRLVVLAEQDVEEAFAGIVAMRTELMFQLVVIALILAAAGYLIGRGISRPIGAMTEAMNSLAEGDLEVVVPAEDRRDEIGAMARAVAVFKASAIEVKRLEAEQKEAEARAEAERHRIMSGVADEFESSVRGIVETLSSAAEEMRATASSMAELSSQTSEQATRVAGASEQAAANVTAVASATEQLAASIREIGEQTSRSIRIAGEAMQRADAAQNQISELARSASEIDEVVTLINTIAEQTNLLALNATIEAARAGDAGKGFAVVAAEVKSLANETARATDRISAQVKAVQENSQAAVGVMTEIGATIATINEIAGAIATAVDEQSAATGEISRNVQEATAGTHEVTSSITEVSEHAGEAGHAAEQVLVAAGSLADQASVLSHEVDGFVNRVRVA